MYFYDVLIIYKNGMMWVSKHGHRKIIYRIRKNKRDARQIFILLYTKKKVFSSIEVVFEETLKNG